MSDSSAFPTPHANNKLALFCKIHTTNSTSQQMVLSLLSAGRPYYTQPKSQCTTWSYFLPSPRDKAPSQLVPKSAHGTTIYGMEIYSDKQALGTQQNEEWFKEFQKRVEGEGLYDTSKADGKGEELVAWYPAAGFVARGERGLARPFGGGVVVMIAIFTCKDGQRDKVVDVLGKYTSYVLEKEHDVLTYCTMVRPKAPNQILLFERYKDHKAMGAHGSTKEFKAMFKGIAPHIEVKQTKLQEFMELDNAFVGNVVGVSEMLGDDKTQLSSKL